jgi:hypothetical protein
MPAMLRYAQALERSRKNCEKPSQTPIEPSANARGTTKSRLQSDNPLADSSAAEERKNDLSNQTPAKQSPLETDPTTGKLVNWAVTYLEFCVKKWKQYDRALIHTLVWLRAKFDPYEEPIIPNSRTATPSSVSSSAGLDALFELKEVKDTIDFDFALRVCKQFKRHIVCVQLYIIQGLWEEVRTQQDSL